jgi:hypothetical protein
VAKEARAVADREFTAFLENTLLSGRLRISGESACAAISALPRIRVGHEPVLVFREPNSSSARPSRSSCPPAGRIFVHGYIDRLDELDGCLLIRTSSRKTSPREKRNLPRPVWTSSLWSMPWP